MNDLTPETHAMLDRKAAGLLNFLTFNTQSDEILAYLLVQCVDAYADVWPIADRDQVSVAACGKILASRKNIYSLLRDAHRSGRYAEIRQQSVFHVTRQTDMRILGTYWEEGQRHAHHTLLQHAYDTPFLGTYAKDFVESLYTADENLEVNKDIIYAKSIPVVQSSGCGKSRMLTEAGKLIYILPICLRGPGGVGYPPGDEEVYEFFDQLRVDNDLSLTAHLAIACFIGALHATMLAWLKREQQGRTPEELHKHWHQTMERLEGQEQRKAFFSEVMRLTESRRKEAAPTNKSPVRMKKGAVPEGFDIEQRARYFYQTHAMNDTIALVDFVSALDPEKSLLVTYFDEAHELRTSYWVMLRLLEVQALSTRMWYIFMGTNASLNTLSPSPGRTISVRLRKEVARLLAPFFALGFDQNVTYNRIDLTTCSMGELRSIRFLCNYGRPLWKAQFTGDDDDLIATAALKLIGGKLTAEKIDHVLAVISQRICLEPIMANAEAIELADRSVADFMRLLVSVSENKRLFHTFCPSEPLLTLGAAHLLYGQGDTQLLGGVLETLSKQLCQAGLVEKGLLGELCGRLLLIIARDFTAPLKKGRRDLLQPVLLLDVLDRLFGNPNWCHPHRAEFQDAFHSTYVNYTHWIVTKDPLPEKPSQRLLANLWARQAALQCCFRQESIDFLIVSYHGPIEADALFDPSYLCGVVVSMKFKNAADTKAESAVQLLGIPRDIYQPLPYFAVILQLGTETSHQSTRTRFKATASPAIPGVFEGLWNKWTTAKDALADYRKQQIMNGRKDETDQRGTDMQKAVTDARLKMDAYNRFTLSVRGASPNVYGILKEANIVQAFESLLSVILPLPSNQNHILRHMRPLERLDDISGHTAWMYDIGNNSMDVDA